MPEHDRFDGLAVEHVLGSLSTPEDAEFRSHLLSCRDCRMRVAELRDMAAGMAAAEREERAQLRTKTETEQRREAPAEPAPPWWRRPGAVTAGVAGVVVVVLGLLFWNLHLRTVNLTARQAVAFDENVLAGLAEGELAQVETADGVTGLAAVTAEGVALTVAGLPEVAENRWQVVWLRTAAEGWSKRLVSSDGAPDGRLATTLEAADPLDLVISIEDDLTIDLPTRERALVTAAFARADEGGAGD